MTARKNPADYLPLGRPTKYRPEFCAIAEETGREGLSITALAARLNISRDTIYTWIEDFPEFADACNRARQHRAAYWERHARKLAEHVPTSKGASITGGQAQLTMFMLRSANPEDFKTSHDADLIRESLSDLVSLAVTLRDQKRRGEIEPPTIEIEPERPGDQRDPK